MYEHARRDSSASITNTNVHTCTTDNECQVPRWSVETYSANADRNEPARDVQIGVLLCYFRFPLDTVDIVVPRTAFNIWLDYSL